MSSLNSLRQQKFLEKRKQFEELQLEKLRWHPDVPSDFVWQEYLAANPDVLKKGNDTEFLALRHYIKTGKRSRLPYKLDGFQPPADSKITSKDSISQRIEKEGQKIDTGLDKSKKLGAVYTCVTNNYDQIKPILGYDESWDYVCFIDPKFNRSSIPAGWQVRVLPDYFSSLDPTRKARAIKILPHIFLSEYERTIWVDGSIEILMSPSFFYYKMIEEEHVELAIAIHPDRTCIYQEVEACVKFSKDNSRVLRDQAKEYKEEGYPANWGLVQTGIIYRKNTPDVRKFCEMWWQEVLKKSKRDQMSFNYILWKFPIKIKPLAPSIFVSKYFHLWTHKDGTNQKAKIRKSYDHIQNYINGEPAKIKKVV